jgi:ribosomal protein S27AE
MSENSCLCPRCGTEMIPGRLKVPMNQVYVVSYESMDNCSLEALICPECGHVELQAIHPEKLSCHDNADPEKEIIPEEYWR